MTDLLPDQRAVPGSTEQSTHPSVPPVNSAGTPLPPYATVLLTRPGCVSEESLAALRREGLAVAAPETDEDPLAAFSRLSPDVVVGSVCDDDSDFAVLGRLRDEHSGRSVPVVLITSGAEHQTLTGLELGADDCVPSTASGTELAARIRTKIARVPVPAGLVTRDLRTGLLVEQTLVEEAGRELDRGRRVGREGALGVVGIQEMSRLTDRFGAGVASQIFTQVAERIGGTEPLQRLGLDRGGRLLLLLPETGADEVHRTLSAVAATIASERFTLAGGDTVRLTPVTGWVPFALADDREQLHGRAVTAMRAAADNLDLQPVRWQPSFEQTGAARRERPLWDRVVDHSRVPLQFLATLVIGVGLPFLAYLGLAAVGFDISGVAYWVVMAALLITAATIWIEGLYALDPKRPPDEPASAAPPATALIAAYLPNEAATIMDTVEAFRRIDYDNDLQILVAYNTPHPLAVEEELADMARLDPRVVLLKVPNSTSKAQNVNAALSHVTGEFVGMFDADHHPEPDSFNRAWRWLSHGADVVQGHCVIRNGDASLIARTVAVEFEAIYAVSHPGRTAMHGFGVFGGSNGYWRTSLLARTRMRGSMLTEDIDSTLRVLADGHRIESDPGLISYELAPTNVNALWKQRARWAQGWFQVSRKHLRLAFTSSKLGRRQKAGLAFLLGWREIYPWLSLQMFPVLAFTAYREGGLDELNWLAPALVLATLFTVTVGPLQTVFAYRLAVPQLRERKAWFWSYLLVSSVVYTEWKNVVARIAQIKELVGEAHWNVTPRTADDGEETA